jgi:hypothetical protein
MRPRAAKVRANLQRDLNTRRYSELVVTAVAAREVWRFYAERGGDRALASLSRARPSTSHLPLFRGRRSPERTRMRFASDPTRSGARQLRASRHPGGAVPSGSEAAIGKKG